MVKRGEYGMKSGKGFHVWTDKSASKIREGSVNIFKSWKKF